MCYINKIWVEFFYTHSLSITIWFLFYRSLMSLDILQSHTQKHKLTSLPAVEKIKHTVNISSSDLSWEIGQWTHSLPFWSFPTQASVLRSTVCGLEHTHWLCGSCTASWFSFQCPCWRVRADTLLAWHARLSLLAAASRDLEIRRLAHLSIPDACRQYFTTAQPWRCTCEAACPPE